MSGIPTKNFGMDTVCTCAKFLADEVPDKELFVFYDGENRDAYTARELYTLAGRLANRLRQQGFRHQDVIANTLVNSPERIITDLGIMMAGCVAMSGQPLMADGSDFFQALRKSRCRGIVVSVGENSAAWQLLGKQITVSSLPYIGEVCIQQAPEINTAIIVHRDKDGQKKPFIHDLKTCADEVFENNDVHPEDLAVVITTSGSTGYSKLVPRSHKEIVNSNDWFITRVEWTHPRDNKSKLFCECQLGWSFGSSLKAYCTGDTRVLRDKMSTTTPLSGADLWRLIVTEQCNAYTMSSRDLELIYEHVTRTEGPTYKLDVVQAAGMPFTEVQVKKMLTLSRRVDVFYGSTETLRMAMKRVNGPDDVYKSNNCGKPMKGVKIRVINNTGEISKPGVTGTIQVKGPFVFRGYFNRLEDPDPQTQKVFTSDGWYNTNDYGYIDDSGELFVLGRNNDTIMYGQYLLYPSWMENKLMEHPDITMACLVPVSDPVICQNICACLKLVPGSELSKQEIENYCQISILPNVSSFIAPVPGFYLLFKDDFPETVTGKPDKVTLKKLAEDKFGRNGRSNKETCIGVINRFLIVN